MTGGRTPFLSLARLNQHNKSYGDDSASHPERLQTVYSMDSCNKWDNVRHVPRLPKIPLGKMPSATPSEQEILFQATSSPSTSPFTRSLEKAASIDKDKAITRKQFQDMAQKVQQQQLQAALARAPGMPTGAGRARPAVQAAAAS